ncbi:MAG TPA: patatin-like phospholipase family protein [Bacteroidales bacterium]|nr:patatin-like phospholipase family protein [Bacteroidales bacterium]
MKLHYFIILLSLSIPFRLNAQPNGPKAPKIGLVLSGGGAKGLAHIGVLKVLEEVGMPVDYITGTSMGSVVGGLYACGYSAAKIEDITRRIKWNEVLLDQISRKNISVEEKDDYGRYVGEFPIVKGKIVLPRALVDGQKVSMLLSHYTWPFHTISDFDSLPIPFRCIATDIVNVKPVVLRKGFLPDAIRASMAIPSFFSPLELDGKMLVDGGILRNFPVQDAREMGADIIIGVEVSASLYTKDQLTSAVRIMDQVSSFEAARSNAQQASMCDILIKPDIGIYNMFSFDNIDSLILIGERAARKVLPQLKALADSIRQIQPVLFHPNNPPQSDSIYISEIRYEGLERVSKNLVKGNFEIKDTGWIKLDELELGIERLYGTQFFERVNYKIDPDHEGSVLTLRLKEQSFNKFNFSFHYDPYLRTALLLNSTFRNVLGEGSKLTLDLKMGQYPGFDAEYSIHTFARPNIGVSLKTGFNSFPAKFYTVEGLLKENYEVYHYVSELDLYSTVSKAFMMRTGIQGEVFDVYKEVEVNDTANFNLNAISLYGRLRFDTQDRAVFATKGDNFFAEIKYVMGTKYFDSFSWDKSFWRIVSTYTKYIPVTSRFVIIPGINGGLSLSKNVPFAYLNFLGGISPMEKNLFPFDGLKYMTVLSNNIATVNLGFRLEPWKGKYITVRANYARAATDMDDFIYTPAHYYSIGLSAGVETILGPVEFTISKCASAKNPFTEIKIGYPF